MGRFKSRVGVIFGTLIVTNDWQGKKFECKCSDCGETREYRKYSVLRGQKCLACGVHRLVKSIVGEIYGQLEVVKDGGSRKVTCRCVKCGWKKEYYKGTLSKRNPLCGNCQITSCFVNRVGELHGQLRVLKDEGGGVLICECEDCGSKDEYNKYTLAHKGTLCKSCKVRGINYIDGQPNVKDVYFQYVGRDKVRYHSCTCLTCGERLILTGPEIEKFRCERRISST